MNEEPLLQSREEALELMDLYENLLSLQQRNTLNSYYRYDLSLGEIAEESHISRAAVHDALHKGVARLLDIEANLGFLKRQKELRQKAQDALGKTDPKQRMAALENLGKELLHGI